MSLPLPVPPGPDRVIRRLPARRAYAVTGLTLIAGPFAVLTFLVVSRWPPMLRLDLAVGRTVHGVAVGHPGLVTTVRLLSAIGSTPVWWSVFAVVTGWLFWRRRPRTALFVAVTVTASALVNNIVKDLVGRHRPTFPDPVAHLTSLSYPSGHAQAAIVGCTLLLLIFAPALRRTGRIVALGLAVLVTAAIGFARIGLGVHYLSDVIGGYLLGLAWVSIMLAVWAPDLRDTGGVITDGSVERHRPTLL